MSGPNDMENKKPPLFAVISIAVLFMVILAYSRTFKGEFQFDDITSVIENPYVNNMSKYLERDPLSFITGRDRPVATFTFALNYRFGGLDVTWYHVTNFIIHILNGLLIFYLVLLTMQSHKLTTAYRERGLSVALISAAIFLLHPIQTESVSYISQRYESLASLFYLCSLIAYIKARLIRQGSEVRGQGCVTEMKNYRLQAVRYTLYAISVISGILALGSKETAITLPLVLFLYDFYFIFEKNDIKRIIWPVIFIALSVIAGIFIVLELNEGIHAGFLLKEFTSSEYLLTQFRVITTYIRLLFLPVNQNLDYDFSISRSLFNPATFMSFLFIISLLTAAVLVFKRWRLASFFILWFFMILAPTSSIVPVVDVIFEHRVYLASAGFFIICADVLAWWIIKQKGMTLYQGAVVCVVAALMVMLAVMTFQRNSVWETKLSMWKDVVKKSPGKARVHNNLGFVYNELGLVNEAIKEYRTALMLDRDYAIGHNNLGSIYYSQGLLEEAAQEFISAIRLKPYYAEAYNNLGNIYYSRGLIKEAVREYGTAIRLKPYYAEAYNNLGSSYMMLGETDKGIEHYRAALRLRPDLPYTHYSLALAYKQKGLLNEAVKEFQAALALKPDFADAQNNLSIMHSIKEDLKKDKKAE